MTSGPPKREILIRRRLTRHLLRMSVGMASADNPVAPLEQGLSTRARRAACTCATSVSIYLDVSGGWEPPPAQVGGRLQAARSVWPSSRRGNERLALP